MQAFVRRDEIRAPLKTPAKESTYLTKPFLLAWLHGSHFFPTLPESERHFGHAPYVT